MKVKVIKFKYNRVHIQRFFELLSSEFNKDEIQELMMTVDISRLTSLIKKYKAPGISCHYTMSKLINFIAQIDERRAIILISQLSYTAIPGLYGLDIKGIPLNFINTLVRITNCNIDHISIHYDDYSDFRRNFQVSYSRINTLDISINLKQWQSDVHIKREIIEGLTSSQISSDNLKIKFV